MKQYSCHSRTHATLSRIDFVLCNEDVLNITEEVDYEPSGISDHLPVVISIKIGMGYSGGDWKANPFWLEIIEDMGNCSQPRGICKPKFRVSSTGSNLVHLEGLSSGCVDTENPPC